MFGYGLDPTMLILIPAVLLSMWAQSSVQSTFNKYSQVTARNGSTADSVARMLLTLYGMANMPINHVSGSLTDHYDPRNKTLNLSDSVYSSTSIASIGVAAHEVGHAIQFTSRILPSSSGTPSSRPSTSARAHQCPCSFSASSSEITCSSTSASCSSPAH